VEVHLHTMHSRYPRLSLVDRSTLKVERSETPAHIAGLCVVKAEPLLDATGALDLEMIKRRLEQRLVRVPRLRQVVHPTPPLCGPPLWVDDPQFSIDRHIHTTPLAPPGDEASLLTTAELLLRPLLDRSHPLWEVWFLTNLDDGQLGMLFKIHHAVADGVATVALITSLLDVAPDAPDPPTVVWTSMSTPSAWALFGDNVGSRLVSIRSALAHPLQVARNVGSTLTDSVRFLRRWNAAPRTSLNAPPRPGRRIHVVRLDLETARAVAHAHHAKINDVVLSIVSGGVRELLIARGEPVESLELTALVPATLRPEQAAGHLGNAAGMLLVRLPVGQADAVRRLVLIATETQRAKAEQRPGYMSGVLGTGAAIGVARPFMVRQRLVNIFVTNVPGPSAPLYVLGARIEEVMPIIGPAGNVTLMFAALSYCGRLTILLTASAAAFSDLDVLVAGMQRSWGELKETEAHLLERG
jgi:diacylglycerol O-acyltransferase / wax synthase